MRSHAYILACVVPLLLSPGCISDEAPDLSDAEAIVSVSVPRVFPDPWFPPPNPNEPIAESVSYVVRFDDKLIGYVDTGGLVPGHLVTTWYATFSAPEQCEVPHDCSPFDFSFPDTSASFFTAGMGSQVNSDGYAIMVGAPQAKDDRSTLRLGPGMGNNMYDEVHLLLRDHGPPVEGLIDSQLTSFNGGCARSGHPDATFECRNVVWATHSVTRAEPAKIVRGDVLLGVPGADGELDRVVDSNAVFVVSERRGLVVGAVETNSLTPGDAISLSWYIFNNPSACQDGPGTCGIDDAASPDTEPTVLDTRGGVVEDDGRFAATAGVVARDLPTPLAIRAGSGDFDVARAEIVIVLRSHGPLMEDRRFEQITSFDGGCDVNECYDVQSVRYLREQ